VCEKGVNVMKGFHVVGLVARMSVGGKNNMEVYGGMVVTI
jgi:hypothetical protein